MRYWILMFRTLSSGIDESMKMLQMQRRNTLCRRLHATWLSYIRKIQIEFQNNCTNICFRFVLLKKIERAWILLYFHLCSAGRRLYFCERFRQRHVYHWRWVKDLIVSIVRMHISSNIFFSVLFTDLIDLDLLITKILRAKRIFPVLRARNVHFRLDSMSPAELSSSKWI